MKWAQLLTPRVVICFVFFSWYELVRKEQLPVCSVSHFVNDCRLEVQKEAPWHVLSRAGFWEKTQTTWNFHFLPYRPTRYMLNGICPSGWIPCSNVYNSQHSKQIFVGIFGQEDIQSTISSVLRYFPRWALVNVENWIWKFLFLKFKNDPRELRYFPSQTFTNFPLASNLPAPRVAKVENFEFGKFQFPREAACRKIV